MKREFHIHIDEDEIKRLLKDMREGKPFLEIDGSYIQDFGFECIPIEGYSKPENFPDCCPYHRGIYENTNEWFERFPNCCDAHKALLKKSWFKKEDYQNRPEKVINCLSYTEFFIEKKGEEENWYKEITDYIEYITHSFGTPAIGAHWYDKGLEYYIKKFKPVDYEFPEEKRKRLLEFFEAQKNQEKRNTDFNLLYSVFQKWINSIPDLKYFEKIKLNLKGKIPMSLMVFEPEYNPYLGISKAKPRTKTEFVQLLIKLTKNLLASIDTTKLLSKKYITDNEKYEIDLLSEEHKLKQKSITDEYSKNEDKYIKIIKKWLKNEKEYFEQVKPLLKNLQKMPVKFKIEKREIFNSEYLKVFLRDKSQLQDISNFLSTLQSVKKANITKNSETDITVYPSKTYTADETATEIEVALGAYVEKGEYDPIFTDEKIQLSFDGYDSIINHIYNYGQNLEKFKNLYDKFDEEGFRDFFLPHLNTVSRTHTATGETFNKIGKTDILIQNSEGANVFIAECKLWKGESELIKAIDQLLERYVTWRDEKVALIIFNKDMQKFSELLSKAVNKMKEHHLFEDYLGKRKETSFSFIFRHPEDNEKKIYLELIIFNCK